MERLTFKPCGQCENGYVYSNDEYEKVKKCRCLIEYQNLMHLIIYLQNANIPLATMEYSISSYIGPDEAGNVSKLKKVVGEFKYLFYNKLQYWYGPSGTQKTTLAWWVGRELIKQKVKVYYCFMNNLVRDLTDNNFSEEDLLKKYDVECLIIDRAFDVQQMQIYRSGYQLSFLDNFLRERVEVQERSTIMISNTEINGIANQKMNSDIEDFVRRKVVPYNTDLQFVDRYTLRDDFENINLWS